MSRPPKTIKTYSPIPYLMVIAVLLTGFAGCSTTVPIEAWREKYPGKDVYSISETHDPDLLTADEIRQLALKRLKDFANHQGKAFEILEEDTSLKTIKIPDHSDPQPLVTLRVIFRLTEPEP